MKIIARTIAALSALLLSSAGFSIESPEACDHQPETFFANSWLVNLNENDSAPRNTLIENLNLMGKGGFKAYLFTQSKTDIYVELNYSAGYFSDEAEDLQRRNSVLQHLIDDPSVLVRCSPVFSASPALTIMD